MAGRAAMLAAGSGGGEAREKEMGSGSTAARWGRLSRPAWGERRGGLFFCCESSCSKTNLFGLMKYLIQHGRENKATLFYSPSVFSHCFSKAQTLRLLTIIKCIEDEDDACAASLSIV
jgi:hypothetical protein